jgi:hypothetical protein
LEIGGSIGILYEYLVRAQCISPDGIIQVRHLGIGSEFDQDGQACQGSRVFCFASVLLCGPLSSLLVGTVGQCGVQSLFRDFTVAATKATELTFRSQQRIMRIAFAREGRGKELRLVSGVVKAFIASS